MRGEPEKAEVELDVTVDMDADDACADDDEADRVEEVEVHGS